MWSLILFSSVDADIEDSGDLIPRMGKDADESVHLQKLCSAPFSSLVEI